MRKFEPTPQQASVATAMYEAGHSAEEVAEYLGCTQPTALRVLKDLGVEMRRPISDEQRAKIAETRTGQTRK